MVMPGSGQVRLHKRLAALRKRAAAGDQAAAGQAALLARHLETVADGAEKKADDRCKVLVGAMVGQWLSTGRPVLLHDQLALLDALNDFLVRTAERDAVLGEDGTGSEAFHRVYGRD